MAKARKRKMAAAARVKRAPPVEDHTVVVQTLIWLGKLGAGFIISTALVWTAWNTLGLPKVATYEYVDGVVRPISAKQDEQGASILAGRIETLKASKQLQAGDRSKLEVQSHITKDPTAISLIATQQKTIDDTIKGIDDQIADLAADLKRQKREK
jgi:hypothetical protein